LRKENFIYFKKEFKPNRIKKKFNETELIYCHTLHVTRDVLLSLLFEKDLIEMF